MGKVVDVKLVGISADGTNGKDVEIAGRIFGITFNEDPHEEDENRDIFTFPDGPITVVKGQTSPFTATRSFVLSTFPFEPLRLHGKFLKFGAELNFGSEFATVASEDLALLDQEVPHRVRIVSGNAEVRLDFILKVTNVS
jgi:hypothetical protein